LRWLKHQDGANGRPGWRGQPIFYPVLTEEYATKIARDWNVGSPARVR
jgi:hypothetical protein